MPLKCLVVEDEPIAAGILEDFIHQLPFLNLIGVCPDAFYAAEVLQHQVVDVMFLDIHLPGLKGLDFLKTVAHPPQVILSTAYHEFALESYDLGVVDYLLKPIAFDRFLKAVQKLKLPEPQRVIPERSFHFFNVNKKMVRVWLDEIIYAESIKEYIKLHLVSGKTLLTRMQLPDLEQIFAGRDVLRIHRSYLIATRHLEAYVSNEVQVGGINLPVGRQYQTQVAAFLDAWSAGT